MEFIKALYIDPGTGGMLFTVIFGLFGVVIFAFRTLIMKMKFRTSGNKDTSINNRKIPIVIFAESKRYFGTFSSRPWMSSRRENKRSHISPVRKMTRYLKRDTNISAANMPEKATKYSQGLILLMQRYCYQLHRALMYSNGKDLKTSDTIFTFHTIRTI